MKQKEILLPKIKSDNNALLSVQKKGQGVRIYRSKSVKSLPKIKQLHIANVSAKKNGNKNVCQT